VSRAIAPRSPSSCIAPTSLLAVIAVAPSDCSPAGDCVSAFATSALNASMRPDNVAHCAGGPLCAVVVVVAVAVAVAAGVVPFATGCSFPPHAIAAHTSPKVIHLFMQQAS